VKGKTGNHKKSNFYKVTATPILLYVSEQWVIKQEYQQDTSCWDEISV